MRGLFRYDDLDVCAMKIIPTFGLSRSTLLAAVESMGGIPVDLGIIRDKQASLREAIETALKHCHVLVTSGGVSMGEADLLKPILEVCLPWEHGYG